MIKRLFKRAWFNRGSILLDIQARELAEETYEGALFWHKVYEYIRDYDKV